MSDSVQPWQRLIDSDESSRWYSRFLIYRDMGPSRSLLGAVNIDAKAKDSTKKRIINLPGAWNDAANRWKWRERADAWDTHNQAENETRAAILREIEAQEKKKILTTGYAQMHLRVEALDRMARTIEASFIEYEENEEGKLEGKINYRWLNPDKIREWRGVLDDIAKEIGDRVHKKELTGKNGGPIVYATEWGGGVLADSEEGE